MNTKKALWVKRPKSFINIDLHSFSWTEEENSSVFWTVGEEGEISLRRSNDESVDVDFVLLHTPSDFGRFKKKGILSSFFSLTSFTPLSSFASLRMKKESDTISFFSEDDLVYKIENPAFLGSASFGFEIKGKGKVKLEVF